MGKEVCILWTLHLYQEARSGESAGSTESTEARVVGASSESRLVDEIGDLFGYATSAPSVTAWRSWWLLSATGEKPTTQLYQRR